MKNEDRFSVLIVVILGVYLTLAAVVAVKAYDWTIGSGGTRDEFTKVAAIWITLLTSLLTAITSMFVVYRQRAAANDLEGLKAKIAVNLELLKGRFSAERKSYDELFSAACIYYYILARLEVGDWDRVQARKAEDAMLAACRYTISVEEDDRNLWFQIWQRGRTLSETAKESRDKDVRKQLWKDNVKGFGKLLRDFQETALAKHTSLGDQE